MFAWSRNWITVLHLCKTLSAFHFQICRFLKQCVLHYTRFWAGRYKRFQVVGIFYRSERSELIISSSKQAKTHKTKSLLYKKNWNRIVGNSGCLDYIEILYILPRNIKGEHLPKRTEKSKLLGGFMDIAVEKLKAARTLEILLTRKHAKKIGFARVNHSDTRPHLTVQRSRQKGLVIAQGGV